MASSETGRVYVKMLLDKTTRKYTYVPDGREHGFWRVGHIEMIDIEKLDRLIVERLLFHASQLKDLPGYDEIVTQKREEKKRAIAQIKESIDSIPIEKRIALLNFLIHEVSLDMMSPRWLRIRIVWTRDDWGAEEMFLLREEEKAPRWTVEELDYLETNLLTASKDELMERLDTRTWQAIRNRGYMLGLVRDRHERSLKYGKGESACSVRDFRFMWEHGLDTTSTCTDWAALSILR
jgi:hypothetical protein